MFTFDIKIKELIYSNSIMERLKTEITRKYEIRNSNENEYPSYRSSDIVSQINSTNNKSKQKDAITKLKSLHNDLEHDYILLLKNLSRKILKPKDLIKKPDPEMIAKNIK
jgi:transposase-like protein